MRLSSAFSIYVAALSVNELYIIILESSRKLHSAYSSASKGYKSKVRNLHSINLSLA